MFSYTDEQGDPHEVWFENSESIIAKMRLDWQQGSAAWRCGGSVWRTPAYGCCQGGYRRKMDNILNRKYLSILCFNCKEKRVFPIITCKFSLCVL
jgi:hypothetical protein